MADESGLRAGVRVRCERCGSEAVLVKAESPLLRCCDGELTVVASGSPGAR